jgi:hypothetical protein
MRCRSKPIRTVNAVSWELDRLTETAEKFGLISPQQIAESLEREVKLLLSGHQEGLLLLMMSQEPCFRVHRSRSTKLAITCSMS